MKVTRCVKFPLLIQFFILISFPCLNSTPVLDTDGNELQSNTRYNVFPLERGNGGGLALAAKDRPCPYIVMQEKYESSSGLPLKLFPLDNKQQVVNLSTYQNIVFSAATICVQSTVWKLGSVDEITGRRYVSSGGVMGRAGVHSVDTWFKMEKYGNGNGYKIVWCPTSVCNTCKVVCGNVGVFVENDKRWLGLRDVPLLVVFKRSSN